MTADGGGRRLGEFDLLGEEGRVGAISSRSAGWTGPVLAIVAVVAILVIASSAAVQGAGGGRAAGATAIPAEPPPAAHAATSPWSPSPSGSPSIAVEVVVDPQHEVTMRIGKAAGTNCFVFSDRMQYVDPAELDRRIAAAGGDRRWLDEGLAWIGDDVDEAVRAFQATWAGHVQESDDVVWILVGQGAAATGLQLVAYHTPSGYTVWRAVDRVGVAPCDPEVPAPSTAALTGSVDALASLGAIGILSVPNARDVAIERLIALAGTSCFTWTRWSGPGLPRDLDAAISNAGGPNGWLIANEAWIGDAQGALTGFIAVWAARETSDPDTMYAQVTLDGHTAFVELRASTSAKGTQVWRMASAGRSAPCSEDGE